MFFTYITATGFFRLADLPPFLPFIELSPPHFVMPYRRQQFGDNEEDFSDDLQNIQYSPSDDEDSDTADRSQHSRHPLQPRTGRSQSSRPRTNNGEPSGTGARSGLPSTAGGAFNMGGLNAQIEQLVRERCDNVGLSPISPAAGQVSNKPCLHTIGTA
jgi:hypothetical protein